MGCKTKFWLGGGGRARECLDLRAIENGLLPILEESGLVWHTDQLPFSWQTVESSKPEEGQLRLATVKTKKRDQDRKRKEEKLESKSPNSREAEKPSIGWDCLVNERPFYPATQWGRGSGDDSDISLTGVEYQDHEPGRPTEGGGVSPIRMNIRWNKSGEKQPTVLGKRCRPKFQFQDQSGSWRPGGWVDSSKTTWLCSSKVSPGVTKDSYSHSFQDSM